MEMKRHFFPLCINTTEILNVKLKCLELMKNVRRWQYTVRKKVNEWKMEEIKDLR